MVLSERVVWTRRSQRARARARTRAVVEERRAQRAQRALQSGRPPFDRTTSPDGDRARPLWWWEPEHDAPDPG
jgi:hypothetical protein